MFQHARRYECLAFAWIIIALFASSVLASPGLDGALVLEPNAVWRGHAPGEKTFRMTLPSAGIAVLDLVAGGSAGGRINQAPNGCGGREADVVVLRQSATHLAVGVRAAGRLCLAADAGSKPYRLISSFIETDVSDTKIGLGYPGPSSRQTSFAVATPIDKTEPEVSDPDADGSPAAVTDVTNASWPGRLGGWKTEAEVSDPDADGLMVATREVVASVLTQARGAAVKTEAEVSDPDADGTPAKQVHAGVPPFSRVLAYDPPCRRTEIDDHGDTVLCATSLALGQSATGVLMNAWQDDHDVFTFDLDQASTVELVLISEHPQTVVSLIGPGGQVLAVDDLPLTGDIGVRLGATLGPGPYVVRVAGTSGAYALEVSTYN